MKKFLSVVALAFSASVATFASADVSAAPTKKPIAQQTQKAETFTEGDKEVIASKGWRELGSNTHYEFWANPKLVYKMEAQVYAVPVQAKVIKADELFNVGDTVLRYDVYSCTKYKTATLRQVLYTKNLTYKAAVNADVLEWEDTEPDTYQGYLLEVLCDPKSV